MTALPPAGHLRDELVALLAGDDHLAVHTDLDREDHAYIADLLLPVVARALTEARADELEQAAVEFGPQRSASSWIHADWLRRSLRARATSLRASIRQTDERNDR